MVKPGRISASPLVNYISQEATARGRSPLLHPLGESLAQPGPKCRANLLAGHLGLEPRTDSSPVMLQLRERQQVYLCPEKKERSGSYQFQ